MFKKGFIALYVANLIVIIFFWWSNSSALLTSSTSGLLIALARISGLVGMFSVLTQYTLMSRNPIILKYLGLEGRKFHMKNGVVTLALITLHVVLVSAGYTLATSNSWWQQELSFITDFPYVWLAMIAYLVMLTTVSLSLEFVRRRLRPKVWYTIHVFNHSIVWLAVWHQLANGGDFLASDVFRTYWIVLITAVMANLIFFRFIYPRFTTQR